MDPRTFSRELASESADLVGDLSFFGDIGRGRTFDLINRFENFLKNRPISILLNQMIRRMKSLGESDNNLAAYETMIAKMQNAFSEVDTEQKFLNYMRKAETYISPIEIMINAEKKCKDTTKVPDSPKQISIEFIPLRRTLKRFLELPDVFEETMANLTELENEKKIITNVVQGEFWKVRKQTHQGRIVLPILIYNDDFETNNP